jgi:hypothetical protein
VKEGKETREEEQLRGAKELERQKDRGRHRQKQE